MDNRNDRVLDWDSPISYEQPDFVTLEDGVYPFTITKMERKQYEGGPKLAACPMAEITIEARGKNGISTFRTRLFLHSSLEWKLSDFFVCIGQKKKGEAFVPDWNQVTGSTGWAAIKVRTYETRSGGTGTANEIDDKNGGWLAPDDYHIPKDDGGDDW